MKMMSTRHYVPQRKCVACLQVKPKRELIRLVSSPEGEVRPDEGGREPGRGAYLCRNQVCWESVLKGNRRDRLARALRTTITLENRRILFEYGKDLPAA